MDKAEEEYIVMGRISGLFGVRGWVKVFSHTQPRENIVRYSPWYLRIGGEWQECEIVEGQAHGKGVVVQLAQCPDREAAAALIGTDIAVRREQLPRARKGDYYWADLVGCRVMTVDGVDLGVVDHLLETGANDVLVIDGERERLVPFIHGQVIKAVDIEAKSITVDWDPDF